MPVLADRVKETTATTGTGILSLSGAVSGYQTFVAAFGLAASVYYAIASDTEWEVGIGTTGSGTLTRDTVLRSSNGGSHVNFGAGVKEVFCSYVADRAVTTSDSATLTNKTISGASNTLSNIPNAATTATSSNTASAIVARDASGNFSAGTVTMGSATINTVAYTWPSANGVSNTVLTNNGSGVLTWNTPTSGTGLTASLYYYTTA